MKKYLFTVSVALGCSFLSAFLTAYFVASHWQTQLSLFIGGRSGDCLVTAAKIREGKTEELIKTLEWQAQTDFFQQYHLKNDQPTFEFSHQVLDAYSSRYKIALAEPLKNIPPPKRPIGDKGLSMLTDVAAPKH